MNESAILIMLGSAGVLFHCLIKMAGLQKEANNANLKEWTWRVYVRKDKLSIIVSFLSVLIWFAIFGEWGKKYPIVLEIKRTLFVVAGMIGSHLIQIAADSILNTAKKSIQKYVDIKSNISDLTTGGVTSMPELLKKGNQATGQDVTKQP